MRWRFAALATGGLALILAAAGPIAGQGGGSKSGLTAEVTFRNDYSDMIQGDNLVGGVPILGMIDASGRFSLTDNAETGHRVHVNLLDSLWRLPDYPNCWPWRLPKTWTLLLPPDISSPTSVRISTYVQFTYDTQSATWVPVPEEGPGGKVNEHYLSLFELRPGDMAYVQFVIELRVASTNDLYWPNLNRDWNATEGKTGGIVEVHADLGNSWEPLGAPNDKFHFRPLTRTDMAPRYLGLNEANLRVQDNSDFNKDPSGPCTMGTFLMPFGMTVTRK
jgi:hypothetical protein